MFIHFFQTSHQSLRHFRDVHFLKGSCSCIVHYLPGCFCLWLLVHLKSLTIVEYCLKLSLTLVFAPLAAPPTSSCLAPAAPSRIRQKVCHSSRTFLYQLHPRSRPFASEPPGKSNRVRFQASVSSKSFG